MKGAARMGNPFIRHRISDLWMKKNDPELLIFRLRGCYWSTTLRFWSKWSKTWALCILYYVFLLNRAYWKSQCVNATVNRRWIAGQYCRSAELFCRSAELFCRSAELLCRNAELFCRSAELFCRNAELFCRGAGLFWRDAGRFCRSAGLKWRWDYQFRIK